MEKVPGRVDRVSPPQEDIAHEFHAAGTTFFLKCIRDASLEWRAGKPFSVQADSGMADAGKEMRALSGGLFQLLPVEPGTITIRFKDPVYFLTVQKVYDTICRRYSLDLKLYSKWEVNIWPLMLDHYLENGEWAGTIECMREFGRRIVADVRRNSTRQLRRLKGLDRLRKQFPIVVMTRLNTDSTVREWAKKHWADIYRKFFNSPSFDEINKNAELLRVLRQKGQGLVPLRSIRKDDDFAFSMPFELARADSLECKGSLDLMRSNKMSSAAIQNRVVASVRFDGALTDPIPLPCSLNAGRIQLPLVSGTKRAYGGTMAAPIIVKGENVTGSVTQNLPVLKGRVKTGLLNFLIAGRTPDLSEDPADLRIEFRGSEA